MTISKEELGKRVRAAREAISSTQAELGSEIGLSRLAVGQIENATRTVSSIELDAIARETGRPLKFFLDRDLPPPDKFAVLFRSDPQFSNLAGLLKALRSSLELGREMTSLESLLGVGHGKPRTASYELAVPTTKWEAIRQGEEIAADDRQRLGIGSAPIGDLPEVFEWQGVRTGMVALPDNVSGVTVWEDQVGVCTLVNARHAAVRRRFSLAHEYAHVLIDRGRSATISRAEDRHDLVEVRANAFAAQFLMPTEGVSDFVASIGKGAASRSRFSVFDEANVVQAEERTVPGSQDIQLHDVVMLSYHFKVSRISCLYRLRNLKFLTDKEFEHLKLQDDEGLGRGLAEFLNAEVGREDTNLNQDFRRRLLGLALEASRREAITDSKFAELVELAGMNAEQAMKLIARSGVDQPGAH